ncbi:hypothetical protein THAOC_10406, partial [Thalassiosira oceanica]
TAPPLPPRGVRHDRLRHAERDTPDEPRAGERRRGPDPEATDVGDDGATPASPCTTRTTTPDGDGCSATGAGATAWDGSRRASTGARDGSSST